MTVDGHAPAVTEFLTDGRKEVYSLQRGRHAAAGSWGDGDRRLTESEREMDLLFPMKTIGNIRIGDDNS